jgi:hypothetical protein
MKTVKKGNVTYYFTKAQFESQRQYVAEVEKVPPQHPRDCTTYYVTAYDRKVSKVCYTAHDARDWVKYYYQINHT